MSFKHRLKTTLRELYARTLFHTGLHALVSRAMPPRVTILAGHCVGPVGGDPSWPQGLHLPDDMKISARKLEGLMRWFKARYELVTVGEGFARIESRGLKRSVVALSMDDGYRDNARVLGPLLQTVGAPATVFLESRPLDERKLNWSHKYFWILAKSSAFDFVHRYGEHCADRAPFHTMNTIIAEGRLDERYHLKRVLKYEADPHDRDRAVDLVFAELGGDEAALCDELYMTWDEARGLRDAGVELGGHTVGHQILSRLAPAEQQREIADGAAAMRRELNNGLSTFAYPWGRRWDFDEHSKEAAKEAGFRCAVTMHAGINDARTDRFALKRLAIDESAELHLLATEACGGFELLRRFGLDLSE
jgi:peptidoglycan/xylan/chitin deacetylase (PgdA/CDA1 family)